MTLPRFPCPVCGRPIALTEGGRLYRHDPPARDRELKSCRGSLKVARAPAAQAVLFAYEPPPLPGLKDVPAHGEPAAALF